MDEEEFFNRLSTLRADTSLGDIVSIRSETDKNVIKNFNSSQRRIYNEWKNRKIENIKKQSKEDILKAEDFLLKALISQAEQHKR